MTLLAAWLAPDHDAIELHPAEPQPRVHIVHRDLELCADGKAPRTGEAQAPLREGDLPRGGLLHSGIAVEEDRCAGT